MVQEQVFLAEIKSLQSKGVVSPNSKLINLNPFIDSDGLLRVGGRLSNSDLPYVSKHPAILPGNHNLTVQIIVHFHRKNLHTGASSLLHYPTPCYLSALMGNLPRDRIVPDYPFNCSGKQMGHVDCLSRYPVMTITYDEITTKLANCQRNEEYINSLKTLLENKQINDFVVKNDVLYKIENDNDVLVVPQQMQTEIVKNIHSKGHLGINKTESMSTSSRDALEKLKQQEIRFGNPHRIITDKGTAFTSKEFREYCENETSNI
ncbi:retrovirus-related Pol polyprotein from transposon 17.6 [Trichonephila clavipes]|nr:retrovirus-related Pol polyprotein from transposon 17.6 [Trichonephila clavipes]